MLNVGASWSCQVRNADHGRHDAAAEIVDALRARGAVVFVQATGDLRGWRGDRDQPLPGHGDHVLVAAESLDTAASTHHRAHHAATSVRLTRADNLIAPFRRI